MLNCVGRCINILTFSYNSYNILESQLQKLERKKVNNEIKINVGVLFYP